VPDSPYKITIIVKDVAIGDITDLAQRIWDEHAAGFDAKLGDFDLTISQGGFSIDWEPLS
jgi:hypothetical protein